MFIRESGWFAWLSAFTSTIEISMGSSNRSTSEEFTKSSCAALSPEAGADWLALTSDAMTSDGDGRRQWVTHSARTAVVAVVSLVSARMFGLKESYWAPITSIVITQSSLGAAFAVSSQRFVGTMLGALLGALVANYSDHRGLLFGICVFALGILCGLTRVDMNAYRFGGVTLAIVLLVPRTHGPWYVAIHRSIEVAIGIAAALAFSLLWPEVKDIFRK